MLIKQIFAETAADATQIGHIISQQLDRLNLFGKEMGLQKIGKLWIVVGAGNAMQVQQRLVYGLLELQCRLHSLQARTPILFDWLRNIVQDDTSAPFILKLHQLFSVFAFLFAVFAEKFFKARQSNIVTIKVESLEIKSKEGRKERKKEKVFR